MSKVINEHVICNVATYKCLRTLGVSEGANQQQRERT